MKKLSKLFKPCNLIMLTFLMGFFKMLVDYCHRFVGNSTVNPLLCREFSGVFSLSLVYSNNTTVISRCGPHSMVTPFGFVLMRSSCTRSGYTFSVSSTGLSSSTQPFQHESFSHFEELGSCQRLSEVLIYYFLNC